MRNRAAFLTRLHPLLLGILLAFLLLQAAPGEWILLQRLGCAWQVHQGEAINVEFSRRVFSGPFLYSDPTRGPYVHAAYPPLFPLLQALLAGVLPGAWLPGRLLAFAGYGGCACLLFLAARAAWGSLGACALFLLFLLSPTWALWGSMVRIDTLALFLEFAAFLLLVRSENKSVPPKEGRTLLLAAGALEALALLCKQNTLMLVASFCLAGLIRGQWRRVLLFTSAALGPTLLVFLSLQAATHGFYFQETVRWIDYGYQFPLLIHYLSDSFLPECGWLAAAVAGAWFLGRPSLLARFQMALVSLGLLGLGRRTSAENYFLDFTLFGLYFLAESWGQGMKGKAAYRWGSLAILILGFFCFSRGDWPGLPNAETLRMKRQALEFYALPGEHLALDLDLPLMAGKRLWIQPVEYSALVERGHWSMEPLLSDIRARRFDSIELYDVPRQTLLPLAVQEEVEKSYKVGMRAFGRKWYVRR